MTKVIGSELEVVDKIGELTQGIGLDQLPVDNTQSSPTQVSEETIGTFTTIADQIPTGTGDAGKITVNFGVGGSTTGSEFTMAPTGEISVNAQSLGLQYRFVVGMRMGRTGASGISLLLIRFMYAPDGIKANAFQVSGSFSVQVDNPNTTWREVFDINFAPAVGSMSFVEFARDESGNDSGNIQAEQPTGTLSGWAEVASARYIIIKQNVV
tara:strand:+ start:5902 stop:6534 length:633 start_codon:yes stop_codon:yes gene_type:complete